LTHYRIKLVGEFHRTHHRMAKVLEDANLRLCPVASDILAGPGASLPRAWNGCAGKWS